jgi:hypothetical protein
MPWRGSLPDALAAQAAGCWSTSLLPDLLQPVVGGRKAQQVMMIGWGEGLNEAAAYLRNLDIQDRLITPGILWPSTGTAFINTRADPISGSPEECQPGFREW